MTAAGTTAPGEGTAMAITIIYDEHATEADRSQPEGEDLWVAPADLMAATGWELKPEGLCRDELCIPVTGEQTALVRGDGTAQQVNLAGFARYLDQLVAHDDTHGAWYFGTPVEQLRTPLLRLEAPDFELPDLSGRRHRLAEHRGKKVLLIAWASW